MIPYNTLIVAIGTSLLGASAGLIGSFAVLRRRALTGDALAHAALPGLCLAFLVLGARDLPAMLFGAFLTGMLGIVCISFLRRWTRVKEDAAIGIVLSVFFGAGIALSGMIQNLSTADSQAGLDTYILGRTAGMVAQDVYLIASLALLSLAVILLLFKEFKLIAFDAGFAQAQGWPALRIDLLLMTLVAVAVVIGLPAVGVVMIAALLILPGVAARFWTDRLTVMLALAAAFGIVTGLVGTIISANYNAIPAGPIIVLVGTAIFLVSALFAPRRGIMGRFLAHLRFRRELAQGNLLRLFYALAEPHLPNPPEVTFGKLLRERSWSTRQLRGLLKTAMRQGYVIPEADDSYRLTERGWQRAAELTRGHRLWELFLTEYAELASGVVNLAGESVEGLLPPHLVQELEAKLEAAGRLPRVQAPILREVAG